MVVLVVLVVVVVVLVVAVVVVLVLVVAVVVVLVLVLERGTPYCNCNLEWDFKHIHTRCHRLQGLATPTKKKFNAYIFFLPTCSVSY